MYAELLGDSYSTFEDYLFSEYDFKFPSEGAIIDNDERTVFYIDVIIFGCAYCGFLLSIFSFGTILIVHNPWRLG